MAAGGELTVSWDLHYAHQGGFTLELYDFGQTLIHRWNDSTLFGNGIIPADGSAPVSCDVDGTIQSTTIIMPNEPCENCVLRFQREVSAALNGLCVFCFQVAVRCRVEVSSPCMVCSGSTHPGVVGAGAGVGCIVPLQVVRDDQHQR